MRILCFGFVFYGVTDNFYVLFINYYNIVFIMCKNIHLYKVLNIKNNYLNV